MPPTLMAHRLIAARPRSGQLVDVAIAAGLLTGCLVLLSDHRSPGLRPGAHVGWLVIGLVTCTSLPLAVWRAYSVGVFSVSIAATAALAGFGYPLWIPLAPGAALFLLAVSRDERHPPTRWSAFVVVVGFGVYVVAAGAGPGHFPPSEMAHHGLAFAVAWFAGDRTRLRREQIAELRDRAARVGREAERERQLAVAEERTRIARDLHDAAGHAINVITVRAGAARARRDPERSQAALETIEEIARQTAAEIDHIVGRLRDRDSSCTAAAEAPIGLASLDTLIADHAATGLRVSTDTTGTPRPFGPGVDQAAYRILQEALTNVARHGSGDARIELAFDDAALKLTVINPVTSAAAARSDGGHGLIGMRERAILHGGSLHAARVNGTFTVHARLPYSDDRA